MRSSFGGRQPQNMLMRLTTFKKPYASIPMGVSTPKKIDVALSVTSYWGLDPQNN